VKGHASVDSCGHGEGGGTAGGREPLVSVVVPAFDAAETLPETLGSVCDQTYRNLDIIVVDDGSTDNTAAIVERHMKQEPRLRLVRQHNGGVASARNAGIGAAAGDFVAFIDADDLWHPTKIAKQMALLLSACSTMALVYAPFRLIDANGRVLSSQHRIGVDGWVLYRHLHVNLVGNGSAILVRKAVLQELGGFDTSLRAAHAEGCEDLLLQLRIATRYQFGEVPEYLVGYRRRPGSMSSDAEQMLRSGMLAVRRVLAECGDIPHLSRDTILTRYEWQRLRSAVRRGDIGASVRQFLHQFGQKPLFALMLLTGDLMIAIPKGFRGLARLMCRQFRVASAMLDSPRHFYEFNPLAGIDRRRPILMSLVLDHLARFDRAYRPELVAAHRSSRSASDFALLPGGQRVPHDYTAAAPDLRIE
jgi:glycosyltransferase involved in cell wall biosynthesis